MDVRVQATEEAFSRREIIYCKRAILNISLVFQNIDPPSPSPPGECALRAPPPQQRRGYTLAGRRGGCGVNILEDERDRIALLQ
jgi:hypothetical protein